MPHKRTVFVNGRIHTMDPALAAATALAVQCERVLAVGADKEVRALARAARNPTSRKIRV